ncbi:MAG: hypothetical protein ACOYOA_16610 [Saprospiraceae bacterium]
MKSYASCLILLVLLISISSCVVTNNLYVNDPLPLGKREYTSFAGFGTGIMYSGNDATIRQDFKIKYLPTPIMAVGIRLGIAPKTNFNFNCHLPVSFGGIGMNVGLQQSFFSPSSKFNMALGTNFGGVGSFQTTNVGIFEVQITDTKNLGALNADFYMPMAYTFKNNLKLILTPRYSYNKYFLLYTTEGNFVIASLGLKNRNNYFEFSMQFDENLFFPQIGYVRVFD